MGENPPLTLNCSLNEKPCVLQLFISEIKIGFVLTHRISREKWKSSFESLYIENLTKKTGNFKTFSTFIEMLKALFLKTSPSLTMDLLTQKDLEEINRRQNVEKMRNNTAFYNCNMNQKKRIYFILVYAGEFDKTHYPLPLEYVGPPNSTVIYAAIEKLENENLQLKKELKNVHTLLDDKRIKATDPLKRQVVILLKENEKLLRSLEKVHEDVINLIHSIMLERNLTFNSGKQHGEIYETRILLLEEENDLLNNLLNKTVDYKELTKKLFRFSPTLDWKNSKPTRQSTLGQRKTSLKGKNGLNNSWKNLRGSSDSSVSSKMYDNSKKDSKSIGSGECSMCPSVKSNKSIQSPTSIHKYHNDETDFLGQRMKNLHSFMKRPLLVHH